MHCSYNKLLDANSRVIVVLFPLYLVVVPFLLLNGFVAVLNDAYKVRCCAVSAALQSVDAVVLSAACLGYSAMLGCGGCTHSLTHWQVTRSQQRLLKSGLDSQIATLEQCGLPLLAVGIGCSAQDKPCRRRPCRTVAS